jgi:hypothetical protein
VKTPFYTLLREICLWTPQPKVKISMSDAYFSAAETMADFFNRIGRERVKTQLRSKALYRIVISLYVESAGGLDLKDRP